MSRVVVAAAVIEREGRVLLTQRMPRAHLPGMWEFPGGKLDAGEHPLDTVVRECREECGIVVTPVEIFEVTFHAYPERDVLLLFYACRLAQGEVQHLQVANHVWCLPAELAGYDLPPADLPVLAKIRARGGVFSGSR